MVSESISELFSIYEKAFSQLDFQKVGELYADTFSSAGPNGVIAQNKAEFLKLSEAGSQYYRSMGMQSAKILSLNESPISAEYSLVKVHWSATFRKTVEKKIEFDVSYLVMKIGEPKIILFVAHQDEFKAMKELAQ